MFCGGGGAQHATIQEHDNSMYGFEEILEIIRWGGGKPVKIKQCVSLQIFNCEQP